MEWDTVIRELGGGASAVMIAGLGFTCWKLLGRIWTVTDASIAREREHAGELITTITAVDRAVRMLEERK